MGIRRANLASNRVAEEANLSGKDGKEDAYENPKFDSDGVDRSGLAVSAKRPTVWPPRSSINGGYEQRADRRNISRDGAPPQ